MLFQFKVNDPAYLASEKKYSRKQLMTETPGTLRLKRTYLAVISKFGAMLSCTRLIDV